MAIDCKADTTGKTFRDTNMTKGGFVSSLAIAAHLPETNRFYKREHTQSFHVHMCFFI